MTSHTRAHTYLLAGLPYSDRCLKLTQLAAFEAPLVNLLQANDADKNSVRPQ